MGAHPSDQQPVLTRSFACVSFRPVEGNYDEAVAHAHHHAHGHGHAHGSVDGSRKALGWALAITVAFGVVQIVGGIVFGSLALLADSVHNLSDGLAIGLALGAAWLAGLPAQGARTFGWRRAEILAALVNALTLIAVALWIAWGAWERFRHPTSVGGLGVLAIGAIGIVANGVPVWMMLRHADRTNLNVRGALIHAATDVLGSVGVVIAGAIVMLTGWTRADPVIAALIGLVVLISSWQLLRDSVRILLEVAPAGLEPDVIGRTIASEPGVRNVHDLHVWTITSGLDALSAHVVIAEAADADEVLHRLEGVLEELFGITHSTLQIDRDHSGLLQIHRRGCPAVARQAEPHVHECGVAGSVSGTRGA